MGTNLIIYSNGGSIILPNRETTAIVTKAEQSCALLGEDVVNIEITSSKILDFKIGDYMNVFGKTYTLNQLPSVKKSGGAFSYSLQFEGEQYELLDCAWLLPDNTYGDSFTGNLEDFLKILINDNISRDRSDWQLGTYPTDTEYKTLTYSGQNCLEVLQNLCDEFEVEFKIERDFEKRILNVKDKVGSDLPYTFSYGRTGGAYNIERKTNTNKNIVTKLFAFGSSENIPSTYRYSRLCLPDKEKNKSYIMDASKVAIYGKRENVNNFDDIKPERVGTVSSLGSSVLEFVDNSMDFDLNEKTSDGSTKWLIDGTNAKITFQTGNLAGYSFDLSTYNHTSKTFKINKFTDENGLVFPNDGSSAFQIAVNDKYIIEDILVPDSYISAAETKLQTAAQEYYNEYCVPHVDYSLQLSSMYINQLINSIGSITNVFALGDNVTIKDDDLGINEKIRVNKFTRNLLDVYDYSLTLSDDVQVTTLQRVLGEITNVQTSVKAVNLTTAQISQRAWRETQDVLNSVFDTEGHYYSTKIAPLSIDTSMLAVGARSQQFVLKDVVIECNYGSDPSVVHSTSGTLEHYTIDEPNVKVWNIAESSASDLDADTIYYVYAKCEKSGENGVMSFDSTQHTVDETGDYYYFLCGTITSVITDSQGVGARNCALTYGSSTINGRFIKTGCIRSMDGNTYFDIDNGEIGGNIDFQDSVITETILIKNGKDSSGNPYYCGAISGNESLPVMWVSTEKTTSEDEVKTLSADDCPVKITKNGVGSNFGCLSISDEKFVEVSSDSGLIRISSDSIENENAALSPITVSDMAEKTISCVSAKSTMSTTTQSKTFSSTRSTVISGLSNSKTLRISQATKGSLNTSVIVYATLTQTLPSGVTIYATINLTPKLMLMRSSDGTNWTQFTAYSLGGRRSSTISVSSSSTSSSKTFSLSYGLVFSTVSISGKTIYLKWQMLYDLEVTSGSIGILKIETQYTGSITTNQLHFLDVVKSNVLAGGGMTCALDSDNYVKFYPNNGRLMADMSIKGVTRTFENSTSNSYVSGWKWGCVVWVKYKIAYADLGSSSLTIPSGYRPISAFDGITYDSQAVYLTTAGVISSKTLTSGNILWGTFFYLTLD